MTTDGKDGSVPVGPRPDGEPALFLIESLIHEFIARDIIDRKLAAEIVSLALEAQVASCDDRGEDTSTSPSVAALARIHSTLVIDGKAIELDGYGMLPPIDRPPPSLDGGG